MLWSESEDYMFVFCTLPFILAKAKWETFSFVGSSCVQYLDPVLLVHISQFIPLVNLSGGKLGTIEIGGQPFYKFIIWFTSWFFKAALVNFANISFYFVKWSTNCIAHSFIRKTISTFDCRECHVTYCFINDLLNCDSK